LKSWQDRIQNIEDTLKYAASHASCVSNSTRDIKPQKMGKPSPFSWYLFSENIQASEIRKNHYFLCNP
jgi:hypothetical protein